MVKPKLTVSGYRGVWGDSLNGEITKRFSQAFAFFIKEKTGKDNPTILLGRDGRESGPEIKKIIIEELEQLGVNIIDGDILPTPTVLFGVKEHKYDGGIIITASHNPIEYNGLKFVNEQALFLGEEEIEKINFYFEKNENTFQKNKPILEKLDTPNFIKEHTDKIIKNIDLEAIRAKKFKIVVDMINASACVMDPYFFKELGVELISINNTPNGQFAHKPEPLAENLEGIARAVKENKADLGFAQDPDADRLVIINEMGEVISEEYTIALAAENILSKNPKQTVVVTLSSSKMTTDIAKKYGGKCVLAKVGELNVVKKIISENAIIGGEGSGGVIYPSINLGRDSFVGIALVLELLTKRNQTVTQCINTFPKYFIKKDKWSIVGKNLNEIYSKLKLRFKEAEIDQQDGLRLDFADSSWIQLRPSNTEPIIRLLGEAKDQNSIEALFNEAKLTLGL